MQRCVIQVFAPHDDRAKDEFDIVHAHKTGFRLIDVWPDTEWNNWHDWYEEHAPGLCKLHPLQIMPMPLDSRGLCEFVPLDWSGLTSATETGTDETPQIEAEAETEATPRRTSTTEDDAATEAVDATKTIDATESIETAPTSAEDMDDTTTTALQTPSTKTAPQNLDALPVNLKDDSSMSRWMLDQACILPDEIERWFSTGRPKDDNTTVDATDAIDTDVTDVTEVTTVEDVEPTDHLTPRWRFPDQKYAIISLMLPSGWPRGTRYRDGSPHGTMLRIWKVLSRKPTPEDVHEVEQQLKDVGFVQALPIFGVAMREFVPLASVYDSDDEPMFAPGVAQAKFEAHIREMLHFRVSNGVINIDDIFGKRTTDATTIEDTFRNAGEPDADVAAESEKGFNDMFDTDVKFFVNAAAQGAGCAAEDNEDNTAVPVATTTV